MAGPIQESEYAQALRPRSADYDKLVAVSQAGERGAAGPQRQAEADRDLENVVGDSLRRSAYQQDEDQRAAAEAGNQLRFNSMSDGQRLQFDILGDQKTWKDADPEDFRFRMDVLEMMQAQRASEAAQEKYDRQQAVLAQRDEDQYRFDVGQRDRLLAQQALEDERLAFQSAPGYDWMTDPSLSSAERYGLLQQDEALKQGYASLGRDETGAEFGDFTPGSTLDAVARANIDREGSSPGLGAWISNPVAAATDTVVNALHSGPGDQELADRVEQFDNGMLFDSADRTIQAVMQDGGDATDVERALRQLVGQYNAVEGGPQPPAEFIDVMMALAQLQAEGGVGGGGGGALGAALGIAERGRSALGVDRVGQGISNAWQGARDGGVDAVGSALGVGGDAIGSALGGGDRSFWGLDRIGQEIRSARQGVRGPVR